MGIKTWFHCDGCDEVEQGKDLERNFKRVGHDEHGNWGVTYDTTAVDATPDGWIAFDPYTKCTYCPTCWAELDPPEEKK